VAEQKLTGSEIASLLVERETFVLRMLWVP
jgi:hypothetical protein